MKKILLLLGCLVAILATRAQDSFTALKITPEFPQPNKPLSFEFDKSKSSLVNPNPLDIVVYQFDKNGPKVIEPILVKKGQVYTGSIMLDSNASCIAFAFSSGTEKDINGGKGYVIPVYDEKQSPVKNYYKAVSDLYSGYGEYLFGMNTDNKAGLNSLEQGLQQYPELRVDMNFLNSYLSAIIREKKKEANSLVVGELQNFEKKGKPTAEEYDWLMNWYKNVNRNEKVDSLATALKTNFSEEANKREAFENFNKEQDPAKKVAIFEDLVAKYPIISQVSVSIDNFRTRIAAAYLATKDYKSYNEWMGKITSKAMVASSNNNNAWEMAEADGDLEAAKKMSASATAYAKAEMLHPAQKKEESVTTKEWEQSRKSNFAMYADTYGFILYKLGDYKTGLPYAREAATINKLKDPEYNERYALLAEKALPAAEAKKLLEQFVKEGTASSKTKGALKNLYIKEKKSDKGWVAYLAVLEASAKAKKREEIAKSILNDPSPKFSLTDFDGKAVSLDDLKGKVVVVDFWATWCGPCISSMPGMHKALEKYKDNENVKFLFVDTWENSEDKLKNAKDFMTNKNYPFHVLMDTENKMVEDFKVRGIPTKFILDKEGNIRFKAVGFSGNDDALVDELSTMIDLAGR